MKRFITISLLIIAIALLANQWAFAQTLSNFFYYKGVKDLSEAAHVSNIYLNGTYTIQDNYVDVTCVSKDNLFDRNIHTSLRLIRGAGVLFFTDIIVTGDDDVIEPFDAFGLQTALMLGLVKAIDSDSYAKLLQSMINQFHTDPQRWNGKTWALFGLNLDYLGYKLKN
ncbi:hypothetical protein [Mucilaginibacter sp. HD30]